MPEIRECERPDCHEPVRYRAVLLVPAKALPDREVQRFRTAAYACDKHRDVLTKRDVFDNRRWQVLAGIMGSAGAGAPDWKGTTLEWETVSETR